MRRQNLPYGAGMNEGWHSAIEGMHRRDGFSCRLISVAYNAELGENACTVYAFNPDGSRFVYKGRQQWRDYQTPMGAIDEMYPLQPIEQPPSDEDVMRDWSYAAADKIATEQGANHNLRTKWTIAIYEVARQAYALGQESMDE